MASQVGRESERSDRRGHGKSGARQLLALAHGPSLFDEDGEVNDDAIDAFVAAVLAAAGEGADDDEIDDEQADRASPSA